MKKTALIVLSLLLIFLCGCSGKNDSGNTETVTAAVTEKTEKLPDNEFDNKFLKIEPEELYLGPEASITSTLNNDGSKSSDYIYNNKDFFETVYYDSQGKATGYRKTMLDSQGRNKCIYTYKADKTFNIACLNEYDSEGLFYRYYFYNSDCELVCYQVVLYDENGIDTGVALYDLEGNILDDFPDELN